MPTPIRNSPFSPTMLANEMRSSRSGRSTSFRPSYGAGGGAIAGTADSPSYNPITPVTRSPAQDTRPRYMTGQYEPGSVGDTNARHNAGIYYDDEGFGASNAAANQTGVVVPRGTRFLRPTTGLPAPVSQPKQKRTAPTVGTRDPNRQNLGGELRRGNTVLKFAPSDPRNLNSMRPNQGGTIIKDGKRFDYGPSESVAALTTPVRQVQSPTTSAAPQTEAANPLTGASNAQPEGTTARLNPGTAMGFNRAGRGLVRAQDNVGGSGAFARRFSSPAAASIYDNYARRLFG